LVPFLTYTPANFTRDSGLNASARDCSKAFEAEHSAILRRYELQLNVVADFERRHGIAQRWTPAHPEYIKAAKYSQERRFVRVVEDLEGLVVQRLLELSKANLAGTGKHLDICLEPALIFTGYKMRKHISKAITRRSSTICLALEKYNKLAPLQRPPRPILDYSEVIGYASLGEFSLLKHSRYDILAKPWAIPENRAMATKYFRLVRAQEELVRLNVEVRWLQHWVEYDDKKILDVLTSLTYDNAGHSDILLAAELNVEYARRRRINDLHRQRLQKIYQLPGFSGERPCHVLTDELVEDGDESEDDSKIEEAVRLGDLVSRIAA